MSILRTSLALAFVLAFATPASAKVMVTSCYHAHGTYFAAHKSLPRGTRLRVTNPRNGRSAEVTIDDRGPFVRGRSLDISCGLAARLGFLRQGVVPLMTEQLN